MQGLRPTIVVATQNSKTFNTSSADFVCNGVDDQKVLQKAHDALPLSGGRIEVLDGQLNFSGPVMIRIGKGLEIVGQGWSTIIKANNYINDNLFTFDPPSSGVWARFAHFKMDCNGDKQSAGNGIYAKGALQSVFEHLWITKPWGNGVYLYQDGAGGTGHHNRFEKCLFDEGRVTNGGDGRAVKIEGSDENMFTLCDFESNGRAAASEPNQIFDRSGLNNFENCTFVGGQTGIKIEGAMSNVSGCMFDSINSNHCIRINGNNNTISGGNRFYMVGYGSGAASYDGVWVDNVSGNNITGNFFLSDNTGSRSGVNFANGSTNNACTNNVFRAQGSGWGTDDIIEGTGNDVTPNKSF